MLLFHVGFVLFCFIAIVAKDAQSKMPRDVDGFTPALPNGGTIPGLSNKTHEDVERMEEVLAALEVYVFLFVSKSDHTWFLPAKIIAGEAFDLR
jgi:hypothetical protein